MQGESGRHTACGARLKEATHSFSHDARLLKREEDEKERYEEPMGRAFAVSKVPSETLHRLVQDPGVV